MKNFNQKISFFAIFSCASQLATIFKISKNNFSNAVKITSQRTKFENVYSIFFFLGNGTFLKKLLFDYIYYGTTFKV